MGANELFPLFQKFKAAIDSDPQNAKKLLGDLKKQFILLNSFMQTSTTATLSEEENKEILLIRETLELAILLSAKTGDLESFERHMSQVRTYYGRTNVEKSTREPLILGLNLLRLLAQNRIAEFHTELELIPIDQHGDPYIKFPIDMELCLMEGSYNKLRVSRNKEPAPEYKVFMDVLIETVRKEIADCSEKAYKSLSTADAQKLLFFGSPQELQQFTKERGWKVDGSSIKFEAEKDAIGTFHEQAQDVIYKTLSYAKEMERIV
ncbi:26S proteasome subunit Rpn12 [Acrasis kona]|uniref:26S proteasome subunit Rpn12 n=1 Tax=Acrasis kona TaxID=1008807 RepID=A0AAW2YJ99_9EUKA